MFGLGTRRSAITFDAGSTGIRACQLDARGATPMVRETLELNLRPWEGAGTASESDLNCDRLARAVAQACFAFPSARQGLGYALKGKVQRGYRQDKGQNPHNPTRYGRGRKIARERIARTFEYG